jgi:hypothetical protein
MGFLEALKSIKEKVSYTKEVDFLGSKLCLGLLSVSDEQKISSLQNTGVDGSVAVIDTTEYFRDFKKRILSIAIKRVDSMVIPEVVIDHEDGKETQTKKTKEVFLYDYLSTFPTAMVDNLFEAYLDFKEECGEKIEKDFKWDWYKTPEEREEEYQKKLREKKKNDLDSVEDKDDDEEEDKLPSIKFKEIKNSEDATIEEGK